MKIKCPSLWNRVKTCEKEYDDEELRKHIGQYHSFMDLSHTLRKQTFKIHERIESLEKEPYHPLDISKVKDKHFLKPEDMPEICFVCVGHQETIIELKSLINEDSK